MHKTLHFSIRLNTQLRRQIGRTYAKYPKVKTCKGKYQVKQDEELALTSQDTVPSTQLHLRLERTPGSLQPFRTQEQKGWQRLINTKLI